MGRTFSFGPNRARREDQSQSSSAYYQPLIKETPQKQSTVTNSPQESPQIKENDKREVELEKNNNLENETEEIKAFVEKAQQTEERTLPTIETALKEAQWESKEYQKEENTKAPDESEGLKGNGSQKHEEIKAPLSDTHVEKKVYQEEVNSNIKDSSYSIDSYTNKHKKISNQSFGGLDSDSLLLLMVLLIVLRSPKKDIGLIMVLIILLMS